MAAGRELKRVRGPMLTALAVLLPCLLIFQLFRELRAMAVEGSINTVSQEIKGALSPKTGPLSLEEDFGIVKKAGGLFGLHSLIFHGAEGATEALPRVRFQTLAALSLRNLLTPRSNASTTAEMSSCNSSWPDIGHSAKRVNESLTRPSPYQRLIRLNYVAKSRSPGNGSFNGRQTLEEREQSFQVSSSMEVHCGFLSNALGISRSDRAEMDKCTGLVVITAIFNGYDLLRQPAYEVGQEAYGSQLLCYFVFADNETIQYWVAQHIIEDHESRTVGVWRIIQVEQLPYSNPTTSGRVFKHLPHRIFPRARYSVWLDGKLLLRAHPLVMVDTFLLQSNRPFALSEHLERVDVLEEAIAAKKHRPKFAAAIDKQLAFYKSEGFELRFKKGQLGRENTIGTDSDLTDSSLVIREHNPLINLFSCLWFNEIDRFQPRDQLSFGYVRRRLSLATPMYLFPHCLKVKCVELIGHVYEDKGCGKPKEVPILTDIDLKRDGALVDTGCLHSNKSRNVH